MSKIKIQYSYRNFANFPKATQISKDREKAKSLLLFWGGVILVLSFILIVEDPLIGIILLLLSLFLILYLCTSYDKQTEKKIMKAIAEQISSQQMVRDTMYMCDGLTYLHDIGFGQCMICFDRQVRVARYRVKQSSVTREIPICECCYNKLRMSLK